MSNSENIKTSRMIGGTLTMAVANFLTMVLGLTIAMVATRKFTAEIYGSYLLLYLVSAFLTQLSTLGLGVTVSRFLATTDDIERKALLTNSGLTLRLIMFVVTSMVALLFAPFLFKFFGAAFKPITFYYVIALFFCDCFTATLQSVSQGFFRFTQLGIWNFSSSLVNLILIFLLGFFPINGLAVLVFARWIAYMLAGIYLFISVPVHKHLVFKIEQVKELVKFGFPLQINDILSYFYNSIDTIMIAAMLGPVNVAYYEIARKIPDSMISFYEAFRLVYFPSFSALYASKEKVKAEFLLKNALRFTAFGSLFTGCVAFLFGKDIIRLLFSVNYEASAPVFTIITISMTLILLGFLLGNSLIAVGESDKPAKINILHATISLLSNLLLIPTLGIIGAAITRLIGPAVTNPLNYFFLHRKFAVNVLSAYLKPILIFVGWVSFFLFVPVENIYLKLGALLGYVLLNIIFSVITLGDITLLVTEAGKLRKRPVVKSG